MEMNGPRNQSDVDAEGDHQMTSAAEVPVGVEQSQSELQQIQQHRVSSRSTSPRSDGALTPTRRPRDGESDGTAGPGPRGARRRVTDRSDPGEDAMDVSASGAVPADPAVEGVDSQSAVRRVAGVVDSPLGATGAQVSRCGRERGSPGAAASVAAPAGVVDADAREDDAADARRGPEGLEVQSALSELSVFKNRPTGLGSTELSPSPRVAAVAGGPARGQYENSKT